MSAALIAELTSLTEALAEPESDLEELLRNLADTMRVAVSSYLGLTITLFVEGAPVSLTAMGEFTEPDDIAASARLRLPASSNDEPGAVLVFYAETAGAFVDFAADLTYALGLGPDAIVLDDHLSPPDVLSGMTGLQQMSQVNMAIGMLIGEGYTPSLAHVELVRLARGSRSTVAEAAQRLIDARLEGPQPDPSE
jgi:hypothetical protein